MEIRVERAGGMAVVQPMFGQEFFVGVLLGNVKSSANSKQEVPNLLLIWN